MLARRALFDKLTYREELRALEDWDFYLRSVQMGERLIVTNELHFYYRKRHGSMISAVEDRDSAKLLREDVKRVQFFRNGAMTIPSSAFSIDESPEVWGTQTDFEAMRIEFNVMRDELAAYRNSEAVRAALHAANFMNARAPWILEPLKVSGKGMWRVYNKLRGRSIRRS